MSDILTTHSEDQDAGTRLDKFLAARLELSRSRLQALIEDGRVSCNGEVAADASARVKAGQNYTVTVPKAAPSHMEPQDIPLDIVYEDEHMLVLNKPPGLTVHPGAGNPDNTLANALLAHCGDSLSGIGGVARPGIVHRIDKDTSGLLVVAKTDAAHLHLSEQLATRTLKRTYAALAWGKVLPASGTITGNIGRSFSNRQKMAVVKTGGKPAATHYKLVASDKWQAKEKPLSPDTCHLPLFSLLECNLETGRTHQIRVHLTHMGHPIVGDPVYGQPTAQRLKSGAYKHLPPEAKDALLAFNRQALHAAALELIHPASGKRMRFTCTLPADMERLIVVLTNTE